MKVSVVGTCLDLQISPERSSTSADADVNQNIVCYASQYGSIVGGYNHATEDDPSSITPSAVPVLPTEFETNFYQWNDTNFVLQPGMLVLPHYGDILIEPIMRFPPGISFFMKAVCAFPEHLNPLSATISMVGSRVVAASISEGTPGTITTRGIRHWIEFELGTLQKLPKTVGSNLELDDNDSLKFNVSCPRETGILSVIHCSFLRSLHALPQSPLPRKTSPALRSTSTVHQSLMKLIQPSRG